MSAAVKAIAPKTYELGEAINQKAARLPQDKKAEFESLNRSIQKMTGLTELPKNIPGIKALENNLNDPSFKANIEKIALNNPKALEQNLPKMMADPQNMKAFVSGEAAKIPAPAAPAAPAQSSAAPSNPAPAPKAETPSSTSPADVAATATNGQAAPAVSAETTAPAAPAAKASPKAAPNDSSPVATAAAVASNTPSSSTPSAPSQNQEAENLNKLERLTQVPGFNEFLAKVDSNPNLQQSFGALTGKGGDPKDIGKTLDQAEAAAKNDPNFFNNLNKTIDKKPGMVSTIASSMGMMGVGFYSTFSNSDNPFLQILGTLMEKIAGIGQFAGFGQFFDFFKAGVGSGMDKPQAVMSNNGGNLSRQAQEEMKATPPVVVTVDEQTGQTRNMTGQQFQKDSTHDEKDELKRRHPEAAPTQSAPGFAPKGA